MPHWLKLNKALVLPSHQDQGDQQHGSPSSAQGPGGEEQTRQREAAASGGSAEGQQLQPPEPLWRSNKEHQGKYILGERFLSGKERWQEGHSEKRAAPRISTAVLGQLKASGSPVACLQVPREEMLEEKSSLSMDNPPVLS